MRRSLDDIQTWLLMERAYLFLRGQTADWTCVLTNLKPAPPERNVATGRGFNLEQAMNAAIDLYENNKAIPREFVR